MVELAQRIGTPADVAKYSDMLTQARKLFHTAWFDPVKKYVFRGVLLDSCHYVYFGEYGLCCLCVCFGVWTPFANCFYSNTRRLRWREKVSQILHDMIAREDSNHTLQV